MTFNVVTSPQPWGVASAPFPDRREAGIELSHALREYAGERPIVVALPRGGVPVGFEIARVPWYPELGLGAVAEGGQIEVSREMTRALSVSDAELAGLIAAKRREVEERARRYRQGTPQLEIKGRTVLVVDDGIATGGTARAALRALRTREPGKIVLATPVIAEETLAQLTALVDQVVCLLAPSNLHSVGLWYRDFTQVSDEEVVGLLASARRHWSREHAREEGGGALA
jgi:putative phosphoribosyl transferase